MAKIAWVDEALQRWAAVVVGGADGSGYPTMSVLHEDWSPPSPGQTPTLKTVQGTGDVRRTHAALALLTVRARNTVVVHYCKRLSLEEQGAELGCQAKTVLERIGTIHRQLSGLLEGK
jgi:DNA-directed RNA polymerase specialized sigma24 family protein